MTREQVQQLLSGDTANRASRMVTVLLVGLITLNVLAVIIESVEGIYSAYKPWFDAFEVFSVAVFTLEYVLRLWACTSLPAYRHPVTGRLRFAFTPLALVDLFAVLPGAYRSNCQTGALFQGSPAYGAGCPEKATRVDHLSDADVGHVDPGLFVDVCRRA